MGLELKESNFTNGQPVIYIRDENESIKFLYGDNGDLYIDFFGKTWKDESNNRCGTFTISDESLLPLFSQLYDDIIQCSVFDVDSLSLSMCETEDEKSALKSNVQKRNENLKSGEHYKALVQGESIVWHSDNRPIGKANSVKIERKDGHIVLTFVSNPSDDFGFSVRICTSGSKYDPFEIPFLRLYNNLISLDKDKNKVLFKA